MCICARYGMGVGLCALGSVTTIHNLYQGAAGLAVKVCAWSR